MSDSRLEAVVKAVHEAREKRGLPTVVFGIAEAAGFCAALDAALVPIPKPKTAEVIAARDQEWRDWLTCCLGKDGFDFGPLHPPPDRKEGMPNTGHKPVSVDATAPAAQPVGADPPELDEVARDAWKAWLREPSSDADANWAKAALAESRWVEDWRNAARSVLAFAARQPRAPAAAPPQQPAETDPPCLDEAANIARRTWASSTDWSPWPAVVRAVLAFVAERTRCT